LALLKALNLLACRKKEPLALMNINELELRAPLGAQTLQAALWF
jgi:hypothetical protein